MTHTQGPWVAMYDSRRENYQIYAGTTAGQRHWIATTKCESVPANHKANAHLIAAAPELLEALVLLEKRCGPNAADGNFARAIIAKATGAA